jgi:hypothetical protein
MLTYHLICRFDHEHQRPDAWTPSQPIFRFICEKAKDWLEFAEKGPDGQWTGKVVAPKDREALGLDENDETTRYDLNQLCTNQKYGWDAKFIGGDILGLAGWEDSSGPLQGSGPVDIDSIMSYDTAASFGALVLANGESFDAGLYPSAGDINRLAAMYGTRITNSKGEWVVAGSGVVDALTDNRAEQLGDKRKADTDTASLEATEKLQKVRDQWNQQRAQTINEAIKNGASTSDIHARLLSLNQAAGGGKKQKRHAVRGMRKTVRSTRKGQEEGTG